jgi:hypothetical protein
MEVYKTIHTFASEFYSTACGKNMYDVSENPSLLFLYFKNDAKRKTLSRVLTKYSKKKLSSFRFVLVPF